MSRLQRELLLLFFESGMPEELQLTCISSPARAALVGQLPGLSAAQADRLQQLVAVLQVRRCVVEVVGCREGQGQGPGPGRGRGRGREGQGLGGAGAGRGRGGEGAGGLEGRCGLPRAEHSGGRAWVRSCVDPLEIPPCHRCCCNHQKPHPSCSRRHPVLNRWS